MRFQATQYVDKWKWSAGFNLQKSSYKNDTQFIFYDITYQTDLNFIKYGFFLKGSRNFFNDRLSFSLGLRTDEDTFSEGSNLADNISPRLSLSYALSKDQQWKFNASLGRYFKIPTYTMLGFQERNVFVNKDALYTKSDHYVAGIEYNLTPASRVTVEGFLKKYSNYPISLIDGVSLANKGGGFEVLGNEAIISEGLGESLSLIHI